MSNEFCEKCGRRLRIKFERWHRYDEKTGKRREYFMTYRYCWIRRYFGDWSGDYSLSHTYITDGKVHENK